MAVMSSHTQRPRVKSQLSYWARCSNQTKGDNNTHFQSVSSQRRLSFHFLPLHTWPFTATSLGSRWIVCRAQPPNSTDPKGEGKGCFIYSHTLYLKRADPIILYKPSYDDDMIIFANFCSKAEITKPPKQN